jgi:hypothetical protein
MCSLDELLTPISLEFRSLWSWRWPCSHMLQDELIAPFLLCGSITRGEVQMRRSQFLPNSLADRFIERSSVIIIAPLFQRIPSFFFFFFF